MTLIKVKPARPDLLVRNPDRDYRPLAAEGEDVPDTIEWRRRILSGDVVEVTAAAAPASAKKK